MDIPKITQESVDSIFDQLSNMEVGLDENPLQFGPRRLNHKISYARGMLTECEGIYLKVSHWWQKYRSAHRAASTTLDLEKKNLFANDPEVRGGNSYGDRDAMASMKLRGKVEALAQIQSGLDDLETLLIVVKAKRSDLKDVQARIRDQIKLCQEEIGLGAMWGRRLPPDVEAPDLDASPLVGKGGEVTTLRDLRDLFNETGPVAAVENFESPDSLENAFSDSSEHDELLNEIEVPPISNELVELDELLKGFDL